MESVLYEIFSGDYEIPQNRNEKLREVEKNLYNEWDKVQKMFSDAFIEHILELEDERDDLWAFRHYRAGFCLGVRLMLEVFTSTTA